LVWEQQHAGHGHGELLYLTQYCSYQQFEFSRELNRNAIFEFLMAPIFNFSEHHLAGPATSHLAPWNLQ